MLQQFYISLLVQLLCFQILRQSQIYNLYRYHVNQRVDTHFFYSSLCFGMQVWWNSFHRGTPSFCFRFVYCQVYQWVLCAKTQTFTNYLEADTFLNAPFYVWFCFWDKDVEEMLLQFTFLETTYEIVFFFLTKYIRTIFWVYQDLIKSQYALEWVCFIKIKIRKVLFFQNVSTSIE